MVCKRSYPCLNSSLYRVPDFLVNLFSMKLLKCEVIVCRNQSTNGEIFLNFFKWLRNLSSAISVQTQVISFTQRKKSMKWIWFFKMSFIYARFLDAEYQSYGGIKADALQEVFQYTYIVRSLCKLISAHFCCQLMNQNVAWAAWSCKSVLSIMLHGLRFVLYNYEIQKEYLVLL